MWAHLCDSALVLGCAAEVKQSDTHRFQRLGTVCVCSREGAGGCRESRVFTHKPMNLMLHNARVCSCVCRLPLTCHV